MKYHKICLVAAVLLVVGACGAVEPSDENNSTGVCGNGVVEGGEVCDDGNQLDDLSCSSDCQAYCGDGVLDERLGEACDGDDFGAQTCGSLGFGPGTLDCQGCAVDASGCDTACGNGACQDGEYPGCPEDCGVVSIACGNSMTCAVLADGSARCWGVNNSGQLGTGYDGAELQWSLVPVRVSLQDVDWGLHALSSGLMHNCAIVDGGDLVCWGENGRGQLGESTNEDRNVPTPVMSIAGAAAISAGGHHSCALLADGSVSCWGDNRDCTLGQSNVMEMSLVPVLVTSLQVVDLVACGQLGDGQALVEPSYVPIEVVGVSDAIGVAAGDGHSCAIVGAGAVRCWGENTYGQLGDGTNDDSPLPVDVVGLSDITTVCLGNGFSCAVSAGGSIHCWGGGSWGSLGNGSNNHSNVPVSVLNIDNAVNIDCGSVHACAILADGTARCWGVNEVGQLGNGLDFNSNVPVHPLIQ
jgi:cysteine-rich repeat protein